VHSDFPKALYNFFGPNTVLSGCLASLAMTLKYDKVIKNNFLLFSKRPLGEMTHASYGGSSFIAMDTSATLQPVAVASDVTYRFQFTAARHGEKPPLKGQVMMISATKCSFCLRALNLG
jgi:hypothetical protein